MTPALARLPALRLARSPRAWFPIAAWIALGVGAALLARSSDGAHGADRVLLGAFGGIALPLLAYAVLSATLGGDGLARATSPLVSFGASPSRAALAAVGVAAIASAILGALLGAIVSGVAHGAGDPPLAKDLFTSAWIGALGAAAYASAFAFGASFGPRGVGRGAVLVLDWLLGDGSGALSLLTPRAHVRNLLGGSAPLDVSQRASAIALLGLVLLYAALAVRRARRA